MGQILHVYRVPIATFFSIVLIVGAYVLARGIQSPLIAEASTEAALLTAIATRDTDKDGLPDWEEALYGTSPSDSDSNHLGMSDGEAVAKGLIVPKAVADIAAATSTAVTGTNIDYAARGLAAPTEGTLTDAFAKSFFTRYLSAKQERGGADLSTDDVQNIVSDALNALSTVTVAAADYKSTQDLHISGSGPEALTTFAIQAEAVLKKNTSGASKSELLYLMDALENNDTTALGHVSAIAKFYRESAVGLSVLPVPQELAAADLAVVNALVRVSGVIDAFAHVNTDPLSAMLALKEYMPAAQALGEAFANVARVYAAAGLMFAGDTPGAAFVNVMPS